MRRKRRKRREKNYNYNKTITPKSPKTTEITTLTTPITNANKNNNAKKTPDACHPNTIGKCHLYRFLCHSPKGSQKRANRRKKNITRTHNTAITLETKIMLIPIIIRRKLRPHNVNENCTNKILQHAHLSFKISHNITIFLITIIAFLFFFISF